jgi:signal transduction histidine kinase
MQDREIYASSGIKSFLLAPVSAAGLVNHVIGLFSVTIEREWTQQESEWLRRVGEKLSHAMRRRRLKLAQQDAAEFECVMTRVSTRVSGLRWDDAGCEIDSALGEILGFCSIDRIGICEVLPDNDEAHLRHVARAEWVAPIPKRFTYGELFPWAYRERILRGAVLALTTIDDLPDGASTDKASLQALGACSVLDVPISVDGEVRFILTADCHREPHRWTPRCIARLGALAETFGNALARSKAVGAMVASQRDLHDVEDSAHLGRWEWDIGTDRLLVSEEAKRIFGADPARLSQLVELIAPADSGKFARAVALARAEPGERFGVHYKIRMPEGEERVVHQWHEVLSPGERTARLLASVQDVTASLRTEQEVLELRSHHWHSDRVSQTGLLVASLTHELSQPLSAVLSNAQAGLRFLSHDDLGPEEMRDILSDIVASSKRASDVLSALRAMLRRRHTTRVTFEAAEAVQDVLALVRSELMSEQIDVETFLQTNCQLTADKAQVEQVLLNLVVNAIDAMRGKPQGERHLRLALSRNGSDLTFSVCDSGVGIPADKVAKVFEAFWTNKKKGLGMGLSVCRSIMESYGGHIGLEANPEAGVTFYFTLPAAEEADAVSAGWGKKETS